MSETQIIAIRHAHNEWNPDEYRPLSPQGAADAEKIPALLRDRPIDAIYTSPYTRCVQTVEPLAKERGLQPVRLRDLRERPLGDIGDLEFMDAVKKTWEDLDFAFPEGESGRSAQSRGLAVIEALLADHPGGCVVISSHGALLSFTIRAHDPTFDFERWKEMTMPDVYLLTFRGQRFDSMERLWPHSTKRI